MLAVIVGMAIAAGSSGQADSTWRRYTNVKYGLFSCYPATLLPDMAMPPAGDGAVFTARDGGELRLYAHYAVDNVSGLGREIDAVRADIEQAGGSVTYQAVKPSWAVISGRQQGRILWVKVMRRDDRIATIRLAYPTTAADRYASVPDRLNKCSSIGTAPF